MNLRPICILDLKIIPGAAAGFLAVFYPSRSELQPALSEVAWRCWAVFRSLVNGGIVGPEGTAQIMKIIGNQAGLIGSTVCFGGNELLLLAGLASPKAFLWWRRRRNQKGDPARKMSDRLDQIKKEIQSLTEDGNQSRYGYRVGDRPIKRPTRRAA